MKKYMDLTDEQIDNLLLYLSKANGPQLDMIKEDYSTLKPGKNNDEYRNNVVHGLMSDEINFNYFRRWASQLFLHTANSIFVYEPKNFNLLKDIRTKKKIAELEKQLKFIFDINPLNINSFELIDIMEITSQNQLLFSFICPSVIMKNNEDDNEPVFEKDVFFSYIWLDFDLEQLVISIPPYPKTYSINGHLVKRNEIEKIAEQVLNHFGTHVRKMEYLKQDWIVKVLNEINEEYFDHNNPLITKKLDSFVADRLESVIKNILEFDAKINNDLARHRVKKKVTEIMENELIFGYGPIPRKTTFSIFLQVVDRGLTQFSAHNGGQDFNFADSREILKKMIENANISAIGLNFHSEKKKVPYKISKSDQFFALKRLSIGATEKEIVDNVLLELNKYKQRIESENPSNKATENK